MGVKGTCTQIVRYSIHDARAEVREGGRIQPLLAGHAEVINAENRAVGYLTKIDYRKFCRLDVSRAE